jgi:hypothetical protein
LPKTAGGASFQYHKAQQRAPKGTAMVSVISIVDKAALGLAKDDDRRQPTFGYRTLKKSCTPARRWQITDYLHD